jgi:hypothetical protein
VAKKPGPDHLLAERESAARLNDLYRAEPHEYFSWRLSLLVLAGDRSKNLAELFKDGVAVDGFRIGPTESTVEDAEEVERRYSFVVAESVVLMHHVSETLLRLYLAHCDLPVSPVLEIARERSFARFKKRVRERFLESEPTDANYHEVAQLLYGADDPAKLTPKPDSDKFRASIENIERWLRFFARTFTDEAYLYNALKHGLVANAGDSAMKIDDGSVFSVEGPSVLYVAERETDDRRVWSLTTRWIKLGHSLGAIYVGIKFIETLWTVSRARYTKVFPDQIQIFSGPPFDDFLKSMDEGIVITTMATDLAYYLPIDEPGD